MEIKVGCEYNIQSYHRPKDDTSYIFRGVVRSHKYNDVWNVVITEFNVSKGQKVGDEISVTGERFRSLVARTNADAKRMLSKEY
jgi:hypothetical protein